MNLMSTHCIAIVCHFIIALALIILVLRTSKAAGSTMAWIIWFAYNPYISGILYFFFGRRKIPGLWSKRSGDSINTRALFPNDRYTALQNIMTAEGMPEPKSNRSIELITDGMSAYSKYLSLIRGAKSSIDVTTFIFGNDSIGLVILEELSKRAREGLKVRIIVDSLGALLIRHPRMKGFKTSGGEVRFFMPVFHLSFRGFSNLRSHRKLILADGRVAIVGGLNIGKEYMSPVSGANGWTDIALQVDGPSSEDLRHIFERDWAYAGGKSHSKTPPAQIDYEDVEGPLAQVISSGPNEESDSIYDVLLSSIFSASREVKICTPYFIPDEQLTKALLLAAKRGVRVRIILPQKSNHPVADLARGAFIRQLEEGGVEFLYYPDMLRAKAFTIDDELALIGSANFDMRSLLLNFELGILVYDPATLRSIDRWFDGLFIKSENARISTNTFLIGISEGLGRVLGPYI